MMEHTGVALQRVMRYIVPFSFDSDGMTYEKVYKNLIEDASWEPADIRHEDHDIYAYVYHAFEQRENDTSNVGSAWDYVLTSKGNNVVGTFVYCPDDRPFVYVDIVKAGAYLFRSGIGLFWYEIRMNPKQALPVDEIIQFQSGFRELNLRKNMGRFYRLTRKGERADIDEALLLDSLPENEPEDDYVTCAYARGKKRKYILKQHLPVSADNGEKGIGYGLIDYYPSAGDVRQNKKVQLKFTRVQTYTIGIWVTEMLSGLKCPIKYYPGRSSCLRALDGGRGKRPDYVPDKAILFNYFLIQDDSDDKQSLIKAAYHLTNGYGYNHLMPDTIEQNVYQAFKDAYWYVTNEGCGYYVRADEKSGSFYKANMAYRMSTDYFLLYIMLLYQSYTLLHYSEKIEYGLSADADKYLNASEEYIELLQKIRTEIHTFLLKSVHTSVGHIQYQNDFYNYALTRLRIKEDVKSLTAGLDAIEELQEAKEDENKAEKRQIEDDRLSIGLGVLSFLAVLSAFSDGIGFLDLVNNRGGIGSLLRSGPEYIVIFVIIIIALIFAVRALKPTLTRAFTGRKKRKDREK